MSDSKGKVVGTLRRDPNAQGEFGLAPPDTNLLVVGMDTDLAPLGSAYLFSSVRALSTYDMRTPDADCARCRTAQTI